MTGLAPILSFVFLLGTVPAGAPGSRVQAPHVPGPRVHGAVSVQKDERAVLLRSFGKARGAKRDALWDEVVALHTEPELAILLYDRVRVRQTELAKASAIKKLAKVAEEREAIDALRVEVLGIIEDEERYFSPYRVPEVSSARAQEYQKVQAEIDDLLGELDDAWASKRKVKVKDDVHANVEDLRWGLAELKGLGLEADRGADVPSWALALDPSRETVTVRSFAWDDAERDRLRRNDAVHAYNHRIARAEIDAKRKDADVPRLTEAELKQVQATNAYREMLGRTALTFDVRLFRAARLHSDYCTNSGNFSHFQDDVPELRTPSQRGRKMDYPSAFSENLSLGRPDPVVVLRQGWCHSSGHHRNVLNTHARQLASALTGRIWVQLYGREAVPDSELYGSADD